MLASSHQGGDTDNFVDIDYSVDYDDLLIMMIIVLMMMMNWVAVLCLIVFVAV